MSIYRRPVSAAPSPLIEPSLPHIRYSHHDEQLIAQSSYVHAWLSRVPLAIAFSLPDTLNLPNLTFQIICRTIATLSQTKGHAKATQGMMRHSRVATTTDVYQQVIPEGVADMVDSIHSELRKPSTAVMETRQIAANLRAKKQRDSVRKNAKLTLIDAKSQPYPAGVSDLNSLNLG